MLTAASFINVKKKKKEAIQMPTNQANNGKIKSCLSMQWDIIQQ